MLSLAKKKLERTLIKANAGIPNPKYFNAWPVKRTSVSKNDPYPNSALVICCEAIINPKQAGKDKSKHNSIDLFCILNASEIFPALIFFDNSGSATVPIAIPAIAKLI